MSLEHAEGSKHERTTRRARVIALLVCLTMIGAATFSWLPSSEAAPQAAPPVVQQTFEPVPPPHRPYEPFELPAQPTGDNGVSAQAVAVSDPTFSLEPKVAGDSQGNLHVVWQNTQEPAAPGGVSFRYSKGTFNGSGYTWSAPVDVYKPGGVYNYIYPNIAVDQQDRVHVVWTWVNTVYYKSWAATETPAQGTQPLALGTGLLPSIAAGADNRLHVVWEQDVDPSDATNFEVLYREFTGAGFTTARNISASGANSIYPDVAADTNGAVHVVWQEGSGGGTKATYTRRTSGNWSPVQSISESFSYRPSIAAGTDGCVYMAWTTLGNVNQTVYRKVCNGQFVDTRNVGGATNPRAGIGVAGGNVLIVWNTKTNNVDNINYVVIRSNGPATVPQRLEPSGAGQFWPDATGLRNCQLAAVWQQTVGNQFDPSIRIVNPATGAFTQGMRAQQQLDEQYYFPYIPNQQPPTPTPVPPTPTPVPPTCP